MQDTTIRRTCNGFHVTVSSGPGGWDEPVEEYVFEDSSKPLTDGTKFLSEEAIAFETMIKSVFPEYFQTKRNPGFALQWKDKGWGDE